MTDRITFAATVSAEGRRIRGSVQLAGQRTRRNGEWLEVDPAALVKADASQAVGRWEHDPHKILGRQTNNTLTLSRTDQGIEYELPALPKTSYADDALELVNGGYVTGSSFEIEGIRSRFYADPETGDRVRVITHIDRLIDVSPVGDPAFINSTAVAFSKESEMPEPTTVEPTVTPPVAPAITPTPAAPTEAQPIRFARDILTRQGIGALEGAMDSLMASSKGEMNASEDEQYQAFATVYDEEQRKSAETKSRRQSLKLAHDLRLGKLPKAPESDLFASDDYHEAFTNYLRTGDKGQMEQFAQSIAGDGTQGGYAVPDGFLNRIVERMKAYGGIAGVAETITTDTGQSLRWPSNDDTANTAVIAAENTAAGSGGADLILGNITLGAYSYDATGTGNNPLKVSKELIQDAAFDIEAFVARKLAERLGRKMAADFGNGTGSGQPKGLFAKSADVMTATTMYLSLVEHFFQVDQAYRDGGNCRWVLGDTILAKIFNSVDENNRPLFTPLNSATGANAPAGTLLGKPVTLDQSAASNVAFGDIAAGYIIRYVRSVQVDVDPYTNIKTREIAYHAWARADANVQDSFAYSVSSYSGVSADAKA